MEPLALAQVADAQHGLWAAAHPGSRSSPS